MHKEEDKLKKAIDALPDGFAKMRFVDLYDLFFGGGGVVHTDDGGGGGSSSGPPPKP